MSAKTKSTIAKPEGKPKPVATETAGNISLGIFKIVNRVNGKAYVQYQFTYYPFAGSKRVRRRFAKLEEAKSEAQLVAVKLANGQHDVLQLTSTDRSNYLQAVEALRPFGRHLYLAVTEYVDAIKLLPE